MKLACTTVFVCFNHSTSFNEDNFGSSFLKELNQGANK